MSSRSLIITAAVFGFLGVAIGAFGAHGLAAHFEANPDLRPTFDTATQYHQLHALAILAAAWLVTRGGPGARWARYAGILFALGIILFSGSLYGISILQIRPLGAVAPLGGGALIAGWACIGLAAWQNAD